MKTIRVNSRGAAVQDVQTRLRMLGYEISVDGIFGSKTADAVCDFRKKQGMSEAKVVDEMTWNALVDASFFFGDRMLYLRLPYFHGHDVKELQSILSVLGFLSGNEDGIFGPLTENALRDFQCSVGLPEDGIVGQVTYSTIKRLHHAWEGKTPAVTDEPDQHSGYARIAEALEHLEACFFGLDKVGRQVAKRIANLAHATLETAKVTCAEEMHENPSATAMMIGIGTNRRDFDQSCPVVIYINDSRLSKRVETALSLCKDQPYRFYVEIPESMMSPEIEPCEIKGERWHQHLAVTTLDTMCDIWFSHH